VSEFNNSDNQIEKIESNNNFRWLVRNLPPMFICLLGSSLLAVGRYARLKENEAIMQEKSKLETEVKFLKSQINPHFLFNSLNNVYALTITRPDQASDQLLKLSDILRYMLYDSNVDRVPLKREIKYLKNYLSFAQLKDSRGMDIRFDVEILDVNLTIAPLLFIPFVENAFKHSQIEDLKNGFIHINLRSMKNYLIFEVENSIPIKKYVKDELGGIGIRNVQQRLEILYPGKHFLDIKNTGRTFKVQLKIEL
jgi:LytS/YehU family sensor histidine kinase